MMRRLPPRDCERNLAASGGLIEDDETRMNFEQKADQPLGKFDQTHKYLELGDDENEGKQFLKCEYNKDGDCYRSPWSNTYYPAVSESGEAPGIYPPADLLEMEQRANDVFMRYAKMYYDDNYYTSVYFFETGVDQGFGSCWLVKKSKCEI